MAIVHSASEAAAIERLRTVVTAGARGGSIARRYTMTPRHTAAAMLANFT